ncbi:PadR family transcriptional regulator [Roseivirga sp. BDSF3-8]|uniref:PadR family transcriptional regulator n=1 Tax=Roseivirga sp. BDSF3-8 TaxID=3241598 RepID=UPI0035319BCD
MNLGYLEETILLLVMLMEEDAYAYAVSKEYEEQTGKGISISAVHTVLTRLEKKGLIESDMGGATDERGGRRKRIFRATPAGRETAEAHKAARFRLWNQIPGMDPR